MEQKREFTGVWIPRHVIEDESLTMTDRIIYAEIACFEVCFKSDEEIGGRYGLKRDTVNGVISKLKKRGLIYTNGKKNEHREIIARRDAPPRIKIPSKTPLRIKIRSRSGFKSVAAQDLNPHIDNTIDNTKNINTLPPKKGDKVFDFKSYLEEMKSDKRNVQIIALYWEYKGFDFENKEQCQSAIKRDLRSSGLLVGYSNAKILETMDYLRDNVSVKWTLETVHKYIDDVKRLILNSKK